MPFVLKNAPSEFQNIMNDIFNSFSHFTIVYTDDVLVYSKSIDEHWKRLYSFLDIIKRNGLVVSAKKIKLFQTKLQKFLGSLNYIAEFYKDLRKQCKVLFDQLLNNHPPWSDTHTSLVKQIKSRVKTLPCLGIPTVNAFKIFETNAFDIGYGGETNNHWNPPKRGEILPLHLRSCEISLDPLRFLPNPAEKSLVQPDLVFIMPEIDGFK
ncbi:uncharacterized protein LOC111990390 [Quercus suber]|uniref:uncharacterized protein LOC111990390 n=1 Tax=Quercus suber TaxID=58331 RepID=UPI000CE269C5|nr:uncharacterized protein LOC111990390 [Quercus suber]